MERSNYLVEWIDYFVEQTDYTLEQSDLERNDHETKWPDTQSDLVNLDAKGAKVPVFIGYSYW